MPAARRFAPKTGRAPENPILQPTNTYYPTFSPGFFGNVVFTNGHLVDGDRVTIYYGASDSVICGARFSIREILWTLHSA